MNRAFAIIGVPAVGVAAFYSAALWGLSVAAMVAAGMTLLLVATAIFDARRRRAGHPLSSGQDRRAAR
jgi:hypothetical protein